MENINEHDMTKQMLDKIRGHESNSPLNENKQVNGTDRLDEHDMTKNMLDKIRNKNALNEVTTNSTMLVNENFETNSDVVKVEDDELASEAAKLNDMVGGVDLKLYEVYPKDRNVVMVGVLDNGIEFKFSKKEQAPYINVNNLRLDSEAVEVVKRLEAYYKDWLSTWAPKINDYTQSV